MRCEFTALELQLLLAIPPARRAWVGPPAHVLVSRQQAGDIMTRRESRSVVSRAVPAEGAFSTVWWLAQVLYSYKTVELREHVDVQEARQLIDRAPSMPINILCMDGGGIRGRCLLTMVEEMETILGAPVSTYFDLWLGRALAAAAHSFSHAIQRERQRGSHELRFVSCRIVALPTARRLGFCCVDTFARTSDARSCETFAARLRQCSPR